MPLSAFDDKDHQPQEKEIKAKLGKSYPVWVELKDGISSKYPSITEVWAFTSKSTGWGMRLKLADRIILYMTPCEGYFLASVVLGEKAVKAAHEAKLPGSVLAMIDSAKKYAEGRGVRFEVRTAKDIRGLVELVGVKIAS
jgi:hypothetical protein